GSRRGARPGLALRANSFASIAVGLASSGGTSLLRFRLRPCGRGAHRRASWGGGSGESFFAELSSPVHGQPFRVEGQTVDGRLSAVIDRQTHEATDRQRG